MTEHQLELSWTIFEAPPDEMETIAGALLVNWNGQTGRDIYDMARAYRIAALRLLDAAGTYNESWESIDPILFCFRHALELHLKALQPEEVRRVHPLRHLADDLQSRLRGLYHSEHVEWLCERIREFDRVDSRSTSFRYHDVAEPDRDPELWVNFGRLRAVMGAIFEALHKVRLDAFEPSRRGHPP